MKVLHLLDSPRTGGATVAAQSVIECMDGHWHRISPPTPIERAVRTIAGYCVPAVRRDLRQRLRRINPDVVHLHNIKEWGTAAIAACKDLNIPVVWSCYDYWPLCPRDNGYGCDLAGKCATCYNPRARKIPWPLKVPLLGRRRRMRKWFNRLDGIITLSEHSSSMLKRHGFTAPGHIVPLPITVPPRGASISKAKPTVLYGGGPHPAKGDRQWAEIRERLHGDPRHHPGWFTAATLDGAATRAEALWRIAAADVLVFLDQWDNPGPVILAEAALLRIPIVASNVGGVRDTVGPFLTLRDADDPGSFVDGIREVLQGRQFADVDAAALDMDAKVLETELYVEARNDPEKIKGQLLRIYESIRRA